MVVDGLPLFGGCQLAVDTTLVCALHCDGSPHNGAADADGVVLQAARRRKERTYPELVGPRTRARLVVLAVEVGGRWSNETRSFLAQLARKKKKLSLLPVPCCGARKRTFRSCGLGELLDFRHHADSESSLPPLPVLDIPDGDMLTLGGGAWRTLRGHVRRMEALESWA